MRLESVRIKNFRSFADETVFLENYTCLVGANGAGKSTVLQALNVFFRENDSAPTDIVNLTEEDFHLGNTQDPIEIILTFGDLSQSAQQDFAAYFRQDKLILQARAEFNPISGTAKVEQSGKRLVNKDFARYFEADKQGASANKLKEIYTEICADYEELPSAATKPKMVQALREHEEQHPEQTTLVDSEDQLYGFTKGENLLAKHIQWVYIPAVKDASAEAEEAKNTAFGRLLGRAIASRTHFSDEIELLKKTTRESYQKLLDAHQHELDGISDALGKRLSKWAHPDAQARVRWKQNPDKSIRVEQPLAGLVLGERAFEGELPRFGHGLQRAYIFALLHELATAPADEKAPLLLLGCEEPELYQHPPQVRHVAGMLQSLASGNAQVLCCTHSPLLILGKDFDSVRLVKRDSTSNAAKVLSTTASDIFHDLSAVRGEAPPTPDASTAFLHQLLQPTLNELFFAPFPILVEGLEDVAYLTSALYLNGMWEDFLQKGGHFIPCQGKSYLAKTIAVANRFKIKTFSIFDLDTDETNPGNRKKHEMDNKSIFSLSGFPKHPSMPAATIWEPQLVAWHTKIADEIVNDISQSVWDRYKNKIETSFGRPGGLNKNTIFVGELVRALWDDGIKPLPLVKACEAIINCPSDS